MNNLSSGSSYATFLLIFVHSECKYNYYCRQTLPIKENFAVDKPEN